MLSDPKASSNQIALTDWADENKNLELIIIIDLEIYIIDNKGI